ncbi:MAG: hypothetical protein F6K42_08220 [Leptolyngbya sp. SIO1D8]|nr:hypothetical protein [Leptolyngbya sp. SIO1D8]
MSSLDCPNTNTYRYTPVLKMVLRSGSISGNTIGITAIAAAPANRVLVVGWLG